MIVLGSNSEVAQAFVEECLAKGEKFQTIYLLSSNPETTEKFADHLQVKFLQNSEIIPLDLMNEIDYKTLENINSDVLFCATGYLGLGTEEGLYDDENTKQIKWSINLSPGSMMISCVIVC